MKIAFLSKRQYMRKDVIDDRYGRLFELPCRLAGHGHEVSAFCLSYRRRPEGVVLEEQQQAGNIRWSSNNLWPHFPAHWAKLSAALVNADVLIGASDSVHAVLTAYLARRFRKPYALDLYDNFESFGLTRIPGMRALYRAAVREAQAVFCVSQPLTDHVRSMYRTRGTVVALESTVDSETFRPLSKEECREKLNLPQSVSLVGTAGALDNTWRDTGCLYESIDLLRRQFPGVHLALAGPADRRKPIPVGEHVHYLGEIPHRDVPLFFNALDVAFIGMKDGAFGKFAFPQKAYELLSCETPVVCSRNGALEGLLRDYPEHLYTAGNPVELAGKIEGLLKHPRLPALPIPDWAAQAEKMEGVLQEILREF